MAIYHFSVKVISRASGRSAVAAAAYRSAERLHDERFDRDHDFSNKSGVVHSEVMLPEHAPEHFSDREKLWNEVEAFEKRKDAQLSREVEFAIPREMTQAQGIGLARDFVQQVFVDRGMIADLNVHWDIGPDGMAKPHAHVMLTMREAGEDGFGQKVRDWNRTELVEQWRERWADHVNARLAELDIDARIDHRSLEAQGIGLEPQDKIGPAAHRMGERGVESERIEDHHEIARRNGERIIQNPRLALDAITHQQATFTRRDMAMFVHRHSDGKEQFDAAMSAVRGSPDLVELGKDGRGEDRFTSREMIETERRLQRAADRLAENRDHGLPTAAIERAQDAAVGSGGLVLGGEQRAALEHIAKADGLSIILGYAGTGKSAMLGIARDAWEEAGFHVQGAALSGIAAEGLENGSGIASRTIASLEHGWTRGRDLLTARDVLVIDEAGMVGTRQMDRVLSHAADAGAKVVLVGDPQQLQSIEAGAAFRSIAERHGGVEITEVRRQHVDWQRDATHQLATGRTGEAIGAYEEHGAIHAAETREQARCDMLDRWDRERRANPTDSRIMLTHTNDEVRALNEAARDRMREADHPSTSSGHGLGDDVLVKTERGDRHFALGDRIMFLRNERSLDVKNGTLGTIEQVSEQSMTVRTDTGRSVSFDMKDYAHVDHGYAATIHKAQGMTVDRVHVLATPGMDSHGAYVALSRHRDGVDVHYGHDDFADQSRLVRALSRDRAKDMASDYERADPAQAFAERRGISFRERVAEIVRAGAEKARGIFDGLRLPMLGRERGASERPVSDRSAAPEQSRSVFANFRPPVLDPARAAHAQLEKVRQVAIERHAGAVSAIWNMEDKGLPVLPHQQIELEKARKALGSLGPHTAKDIEQAYARDASLVREASGGRVQRAFQAMQLEAEIRADPEKRADRFVDTWRKLDRQYRTSYAQGDFDAVHRTRDSMGAMAKSLERDAQMESVLRQRRPELGIDMDMGRKLSHDLASSVGIEMGRGLGMSR
jgi:Ti-type conjugative transfer relaxase TraA